MPIRMIQVSTYRKEVHEAPHKIGISFNNFRIPMAMALEIRLVNAHISFIR